MLVFVLASLAVSGHALHLPQLGSGVRVPNSAALNLAGDLTIEATVKPEADDSAGPFHFVVSKNYGGTGYALVMIGRGDNMRFQFEAKDTVEYHIPMRVLQGHWWRLAGVFSAGKSLTLYVNGVKVAEKATTATMSPNSLPLYIGTSPWDSLVGAIDDVRIWSVARSQQEVLEDQSQRLTGSESGLVACWDFERWGYGLTYDRTHHTRPGQLVGKASIRSSRVQKS